MMNKNFILLGFVMFLTMTGYGIVLPALPYLADQLHLTSFQMGSLITGWAVAQFISMPFWGRMVDRLGRKPLLLFGLFGFGVAFFSFLFAKSYIQLLLARMIGAFLSSGTQPAVFALVADATDLENRGSAMARMGALNGLGFLCGPAVGGLFSPLGVQAPFVAAGLLAWLTLPFVWLMLREPPRQVALAAGGTSSLWRSMMMVFYPGYRLMFGIILGISVAASSLFGMLGYLLIERFQASLMETGLSFSVLSGVSVAVQFFLMDVMYRHVREEKIALSGLFLNVAGYLLIACSTGVWMAVLGCGFIGIGEAMIRPTITSFLSKHTVMGQGTTMGLQQAADSLGRIVGPLFGGWVFTFLISGPFWISSLICLLLFFLLFQAGPLKSMVPARQPRLHDAGTEVNH